MSIDDIRARSELLIASLEDDKAEDLDVIALAGKSSLADIMIHASGRSARHGFRGLRLVEVEAGQGLDTEGARLLA